MSSQIVRIIVDPTFGARINDVGVLGPVWIADTAANRSAVDAFRRTYPDQDITTFRVSPSAPPARWVSEIVDTVAEHFGGSDVHRPTFDAIEVIGTGLTAALRDELSRSGFAQFEEGVGGFVARYVDPVI